MYVTAAGVVTACTSYANATVGYASKLTALTSTDVASSSDTWRRVWFCYNDGTTGRPAVSDALAFQTSTNTLKVGNVLLAGTAASTIEANCGVTQTAGTLYLYSTNQSTGSRGIYGKNNAGTGAWAFSLNQSNAFDHFATMACDLKFQGPSGGNNTRATFYDISGNYRSFMGFSQNGTHFGVYNAVSDFYPVDILSDGNTTGVFNGLAAQTGNATYIISPSGGHYTTRTSSVTGAIKITLPVSWTNVMVSFFVDIFDYSNHCRATYYISGYNYSTDSKWYHNVAKSITPAGSNSELNVRMCHDGSKCCVTIGETNTSWSYPQVCVRDVYIGYAGSNVTDTWKKGWSISFVTSLPSTVSETLNTYEYAASLPTTNLYKTRVFFKTV